MKVLLDTNIIMDALMERSPFDIEAKDILKRAQFGKELICYLTANTIADIFYLYSKAHNMKSAKSALNFLLAHYGVITVTQNDCIYALSLPIDDFEDGLIMACALSAGVDCIITRDHDFLKTTSPVKIISTRELINSFA